jgi:hypothetical protein
MERAIGGLLPRFFPPISFDQWIKGQTALRTRFYQQSAESTLNQALPAPAHTSGDIEISLTADLSWRASPLAGTVLELGGRQVDGAGIQFGRRKASDSPFNDYVKELGSAPDPSAYTLYGEARTRDHTADISLGSKGSVKATAVPDGGMRITVERRDSPIRRDLILLEGAARVELRAGDRGAGPFQARIFRCYRAHTGGQTSTKAVAWLLPGMHAISTGSAPMIVQPRSDGANGRAAADLQLKLSNDELTFFEGQFNAHQLCLAVPGADYTRLTCGMAPLLLRVEGVSPAGAWPERSTLITFGPQAKIESHLDDARLHVKRSEDLVDLKFRFKDMTLTVEQRRAYLAAYAARNKKPVDNSAIMIVDFPPQHVAERAYFRQEGTDGVAACRPEQPASPVAAFEAALSRLFGTAGPTDEFEEITQARLSGPSRIAFRVPDDLDGRRFEIPFDLDALTDWRPLDLSVIRRAESVVPAPLAEDGELKALSTDTARRLRYLGLHTKEESPGPEERLKDIVASLAPADDLTTSIELPFRLFLSPHRQGHFLTPRPAMRPSDPTVGNSIPIPLWTAELDWNNPIQRRGVGEVRAIWSTDFRKEVFAGPKQLPTDDAIAKQLPSGQDIAPWALDRNGQPGKNSSRFLTGLNARDRHELVVLSSVYGLPVLPRPGDDGKLTGDQLAPPVEFLLKDIEGVPAAADPDDAHGQAIYDPQPLGVRELALSSLGGNLDLDASFEPPYAARTAQGKKLFADLGVQRWRQRTVLGRDILVEVERKGFLFPIGHRCTLVKLTERVFRANPRGGYSTAYLTQRKFLRIAKPDKQYPAIGQPFAGRAWPPRLVTIATRQTPDIVDPEDSRLLAGPPGKNEFFVAPNGRLLWDVGVPSELVFWPRTGACLGAEVKFEIRFDGAGEGVFVPLLFVDNLAANNRDLMPRLVGYYNALVPDPANVKPDSPVQSQWDHGGAVRRYAAETKAGEASLLTLQWVVGAEGGALTPGSGTSDGDPGPDELALRNTNYRISDVMNGADQPPFYPRLRAATVRLQSFERLVGQPMLPVTAQYLARYARFDFEKEQNWTFMRLMRDKAPFTLSFSGDKAASGDHGGGVGQPNLTVNAFSRDVGPTRLPGPPAGSSRAALSPHSLVRIASLDLQLAALSAQAPAAANDPRALLEKATILGLPLIDLIGSIPPQDRPSLRETVDFGNQVKNIADTIIGQLRGFLDRFNKEINQQVNGVDLGALLQLYPDLVESKEELEQALKKQAEQALVAAVEPARRFVAALYRAAADPLAPVREAARGAFRDLLANLGGIAVLPAEIGKVKAKLKDNIRDFLKSEDLVVWRRLELRIPAVRPQLVGDISGLDVDKVWKDSVDEAFKQADSAADLPRRAFGEFEKRLKAEIDSRRQKLGAQASAAVAAELDRLQRSVIDFAKGPLAEQFASVLERLENLAGTIESASLRDLERLLANLADLGHAALAAAAAEVPAFASNEIAKACRTATDALAFVMAAAIPTNAARAEIVKARDKLKTASNGLIARLAAFEKAVNQSTWPPGAQKALNDGIALQRGNANALMGRLDTALQAFLDATDKVVPRDLVATACRAPATAPFALMQDLDDARRRVLAALKDVQQGFRTDLDAFKASVAQSLPQDANPAAQALRKQLLGAFEQAFTQLKLQDAFNDALRAVAVASSVAVDAATVLGALSQQADTVQAQAIDRVQSLLRTLDAAAEPGTKFAETIEQAIQFFDKAALRKKREDFVQRANLVATAVEASLVATSRNFAAYAAEMIDRHLAAEDAALQQARAVLLAGSGEIVNKIVAALAPLLRYALGAIKDIDDGIIAARVATIARLVNAVNHPESGSKEFAALATLLRIVPAGNTQQQLACPFFLTESGSCTGLDGDLAQVKDKVVDEAGKVQALFDRLASPATIDSTVVQDLQALVDGWRANGPAAVQLVHRLLSFIHDVLRGDLGRFIDLGGLAANIEHELKNVLPISSKLEHTLGLDIKPVGISEKIFQIKPTPGQKDLVITTTSQIDLLNRRPVQVTTKGELKPFDVKLLGDTLDVATLEFDKATFTSINGGPPDFRIAFKSFKPGKAIEFVEPLERFLSPGDSGPRIGPLDWAPGVAAGFGLNLGIISIGTVSFANVILNAVAELPFTDAKAKFKVGLGRRNAPFLISAFPYTGGGYFAIIANGKGIDGFEASFEFGGGGAFRFGPLSGQGRLTTGIFIRQSHENGAYMEGFFYCGGSARIAFFGIGASLTVRMSLIDGSMAGEAVFEFVFSLGIKEFKYPVQVWRKEGKGFAKTTSLHVVPTTQHAFLDVSPLTGRVADTLLAMREPVRFAALAQPVSDATPGVNVCRPVPGAFFKSPEQPKDPFACLISTAMCQSQDWATYANYFDSTLLESPAP